MSWIGGTLVLAIWLAGVIFLRAYRIWILFYIVGTVGFAYLLVYFASGALDLELALAHTVAASVHQFLSWIGIPSRIFSNAPGILLVMVVTQRTGWTALQIGVESSGLLEMAVISSLILFYPQWQFARRSKLLLVGVGSTWIANVLRMILIAMSLHYIGKDSLLIAHSVIGRLFFFVLTIAIYWFLITRQAIERIAKRVTSADWIAGP